MTRPKRITVEWLKAHGACSSATKRFNELFPKGVTVSLAAAKRLTRAQAAFVKNRGDFLGYLLGFEHDYLLHCRGCWCEGTVISQLKHFGYRR